MTQENLAATGNAPSIPTRGIITPEAVLLEFETAGVASRLLAALLDFVFIGVALTVVLMAVGTGAVFVEGLLPEWAVTVLMVLLVFTILFGYWIGFEAMNRGRTPGKSVMGLRVVTVEGAPAGFRHATIRGFFRLVDFYLSSGIVGILTATFSKREQRLGDQFAGTIVLRDRTIGPAFGALVFPAPRGYEAYVATLDPSGLTSEQYGVVRNFLARVFELEQAAKMTLASQLADDVAERTSQVRPVGVNPELYLACMASAYQQRYGRPGGPSMMPPPVPPHGTRIDGR